MRKMEKEDNFVMDLEKLPKVNQVIYTLDTICDPNIMTLAQAVLEIFCSQTSIGLQCNTRTPRRSIPHLHLVK